MVAVVDVEYVRYGYADLSQACRFLADFGLVVSGRTDNDVLFRGGSGSRYCFVATKAGAPGLQAIGLRVDDYSALEAAAAFPEASSIESIDRPGGGKSVRLTSPDGLHFELVHGIEPVESTSLRAPLTFNYADRKNRKGEWQRPPFEPARVLRLGHVAILTADYQANAAWVQSRFDMLPSDVLFDGVEDNQIGGFFHCTGSKNWTDHHSIAFFPGKDGSVHHCSFEIQDIDAQFLGNKYLLAQGWSPLWGVGRHILGSQVFDYWFDPEGNVLEHFTDGDLVKPGKAPELHQVSDNSLAQWGPPMPVGNFIERLPFTG